MRVGCKGEQHKRKQYLFPGESLQKEHREKKVRAVYTAGSITALYLLFSMFLMSDSQDRLTVQMQLPDLCLLRRNP